jgi:Rrf2 family protein
MPGEIGPHLLVLQRVAQERTVLRSRAAVTPPTPDPVLAPSLPKGQNSSMHISARVDYAVRALLTLTAQGAPATAEVLAAAQHLPPKFLGAILTDLRRAGLVRSQRGGVRGYLLGRPPAEITVADVMRALEGPLAEIRGLRPEDTAYDGPAEHLQDVWVAVRAALRAVLEQVSLADIVAGTLPGPVAEMAAEPDAWISRIR